MIYNLLKIGGLKIMIKQLIQSQGAFYPQKLKHYFGGKGNSDEVHWWMLGNKNH